MATVTFKLSEKSTLGDAAASLKEICSITDLFNVEAVFPVTAQGKNEFLYTGQVRDEEKTEEVVKAIKAVPNVQYAQKAPKRWLM